MELWIRSQDRDYLIKVKSLVIEESKFNIYQIFGDGRYLGTYKTKERALEVLDEIQGKLNIRHCDGMGAEFIVLSEIVPIIYEMPKE